MGKKASIAINVKKNSNVNLAWKFMKTWPTQLQCNVMSVWNVSLNCSTWENTSESKTRNYDTNVNFVNNPLQAIIIVLRIPKLGTKRFVPNARHAKLHLLRINQWKITLKWFMKKSRICLVNTVKNNFLKWVIWKGMKSCTQKTTKYVNVFDKISEKNQVHDWSMLTFLVLVTNKPYPWLYFFQNPCINNPNLYIRQAHDLFLIDHQFSFHETLFSIFQPQCLFWKIHKMK